MRRRETRRSPQIPSRQRGAIAVMAAVVIMFILFPMLGLVTMTGFLFNANRQVVNYADSVSAAWGLQMVQLGRTDWYAQAFDDQALAAGHGYSSNKASASSPQYVTMRDGDIDTYDRYTASYAYITAQAPYGLYQLTQAWFPSFALDSLRTWSRVRVNQITLRSYTLYRQPVMLMMDFSSTMRLPYTGKNGAEGEIAATALQRVAKTLIKDSTFVYNLGVMGFSDGVEDKDQLAPPSKGSTTNNVNDAWDQERRRRDAMEAQVGTWVANGDGTNIQRAIQDAGSEITDAIPTSFPLQKPMMIIITDGEPNLSENAKKGSGKSLEDLQKAAAEDAKTAMNAQRRATKEDIPAGVDALVLQIQRQQTDTTQGANLKQADEDFLRNDLSGPANNNHDPNYFHQDGGDPNELSRYMQIMPKFPFCEFASRLDQLQGFSSNNAPYPVPDLDVIGAFVAYNDGLDEIAIPNIFTDKDKYLLWASDPAHAAYLTAGADPRGQNLTTAPLGKDNLTGLDVLRTHPDQFLGLWYDRDTKKIYVGGMLCAALALPSLNTDQTVRLRIRYGYPQLANTKDAVNLGR